MREFRCGVSHMGTRSCHSTPAASFAAHSIYQAAVASCTSYLFRSKNLAGYEPSLPVVPVISALFMNTYSRPVQFPMQQRHECDISNECPIPLAWHKLMQNEN